jgi:hypothetical protein
VCHLHSFKKRSSHELASQVMHTPLLYCAVKKIMIDQPRETRVDVCWNATLMDVWRRPAQNWSTARTPHACQVSCSGYPKISHFYINRPHLQRVDLMRNFAHPWRGAEGHTGSTRTAHDDRTDRTAHAGSAPHRKENVHSFITPPVICLAIAAIDRQKKKAHSIIRPVPRIE